MSRNRRGGGGSARGPLGDPDSLNCEADMGDKFDHKNLGPMCSVAYQVCSDVPIKNNRSFSLFTYLGAGFFNSCSRYSLTGANNTTIHDHQAPIFLVSIKAGV